MKIDKDLSKLCESYTKVGKNHIKLSSFQEALEHTDVRRDPREPYLDEPTPEDREEVNKALTAPHLKEGDIVVPNDGKHLGYPCMIKKVYGKVKEVLIEDAAGSPDILPVSDVRPAKPDEEHAFYNNTFSGEGW